MFVYSLAKSCCRAVALAITSARWGVLVSLLFLKGSSIASAAP